MIEQLPNEPYLDYLRRCAEAGEFSPPTTPTRDAMLNCAEAEPISFVHHALERLVRLHDEHLTAEPPLEERSDEEYNRWAYAMSDAWDDARAALKEALCGNDAETDAELKEKRR